MNKMQSFPQGFHSSTKLWKHGGGTAKLACLWDLTGLLERQGDPVIGAWAWKKCPSIESFKHHQRAWWVSLDTKYYPCANGSLLLFGGNLPGFGDFHMNKDHE